MITAYQTEPWSEVLPELKPLFPLHWEEIATNHSKVPLDIDYERYAELEALGVLHVATARQEDKLVAYQVTMVAPHLHYRSTLHAITDVYYLVPERRMGMVGPRLFRFVEHELAARVPKGQYLKLITAMKLHFMDGRVGQLFERMGYDPTETTFTKVIEGTG